MNEYIDLSILIPVKDEAGNVGPLHQEITEMLKCQNWTYEIFFIDDGSTDGTPERLRSIRERDPEHVRVALLRTNCGQTAALSAGIDLARGRILVPMDGDGQNDPAEIPRLLAKLEEGYDVVSGWRKERKDHWLTRRLPSMLANRLAARISGLPLRDFGCTLKAYRREALEGVRLYGEMHRFIPVFAAWGGARVAELVVNHRPRAAGRTKYGLGRTFNVLLDLILLRFYRSYAQRPIHFFGRAGLISLALAILCFVLMLYYKYVFPFPFPVSPEVWRPKTFIETPLPVLSVVFLLGALQCVLTGLVAEMVMRTYYESQDKRTYLLAAVLPEERDDRDDASG